MPRPTIDVVGLGTMTSAPEASAFFLPSSRGQRLCIVHSPSCEPGSVRAAMVYVHPLGDEMNKSRHMVAMAARALARSGCAVLQIDLFGCGDSSGSFQEASWSVWLNDVEAATDWLSRHYPQAPLWLWGLRAGALLASEAASRQSQLKGLLLWQPSVSGRIVLQQWLRLAAAGSLLADGAAPLTGTQLRAALATGQPVDIAGYTLGVNLAQAIDAAELCAPAAACEVHWLELAPRAEATLTAASRPIIDGWRSGGVAVHARALDGPQFWQSAELETAPSLIQASVAAVCGIVGITA